MVKNLYWSVIAYLLVPTHFLLANHSGDHIVGSVPAENTGPIIFHSPLKNSIGGLSELVDVILRAIIQIGTPIAAIFIIYSGFLFVIARGNDTKLTKAKETLMWTLIGTAVLIGSAVIAGVIKATMDQIIG